MSAPPGTGRGDGGVVLVTGASGFVGNAVVARLVGDGHRVRAASRREVPSLSAAVEQVIVAPLSAETNWAGALADVRAVVHAAARVHVMRETVADPLAEFRRVNVQGTMALAEQAAAAGVRRFVFISSIKVNGESTSPGRPFTESDAPAPVDPYGISKLEAERALFALGAASGMEIVVIRPVLVYGPGAKGNFRSMLRLVKRGFPLPLGGVRNSRSLVALGNLVDLIAKCLDHPAAANQIFMVSDGEDLSTPDLMRRAARAMGRSAHLVSIPPALLNLAGRSLGRGDMMRRLLGSLQVDISKARTVLGWRPPVSVDDGLRAAAGRQ